MADTDDTRSRRDAFFGLHFDLHAGAQDTELGADVTEAMVANLLDKVRPDYVQQDCKGHPGYTSYPTTVGTPSPGIAQDALAIWRKVTREHGVGLYVHYSGVFDVAAVSQHPEWAREDAEGKRDEQATSTFGPYVDELLIPQLTEVIEQYDIDGAWIDGDCWSARIDFSPEARAAFTEATGIEDIPLDATSPHWAEYLTFQRDRFLAYVTRYADALHAVKPSFEVASNWLYSTHVPQRPAAPVDFLSGDFSPGNAVNHARREARYLASNEMPWDLMAWGFNRSEHYGRAYKPAVQLMQEASVVLAQGGGFQVYNVPTRAGWVDDAIVETMADVAQFCRAREDVSHKTEPVPQVALLMPGQSLYAKQDRLFGGWGAALDPVDGVLHALLELHYSVDVMAEWALKERLERYPVVAVPECAIVPADLRQALREYVAGGGSLLLVGHEPARQFGDMLGVDFVGDSEDTTAFVLEAGVACPFAGAWQDIALTTAECAGTRYGVPSSHEGGQCGASVNTHGKGLVAGIYGPLGTAHSRTHHPAIRTFLGNVVGRIFHEPIVRVEGPPWIDVSVRRNERGLLIHLANLAGMQMATPYSAIDAIPSSGPIRLTIPMAERPDSVALIPSDEGMTTRWEQGALHVEIASIAIHEVVAIS